MKVKVRYFAFLTDFTRKSEEYIDTTCKKIDCLVEQLAERYGENFGKIIKEGYNGIKIIILINGKQNVDEINENDEIAFLPPPSGGSIVYGKLDVLEEIRKAREEATIDSGSMVIYIGFVKGVVENHRVFELRYQSYEEYTRKRLIEIQEEIKRKYKSITNIKIFHSIGDMKPGEDVILIIGIGKDRHETFKAVEEALELVKHTTGIWKLEIRDDGEYWVVAGSTRVRRIEERSGT
ncbi:MAG: MoaD family protein [Sulfolobaceae archaeon]